MISQKNRQRIFRLCTMLGFNDEMRHDITKQVTGKESLKEISDLEAGKVVRCLAENAKRSGLIRGKKWTAEESIKRGTQRNTRVHNPKVYNLMSPEQKDKIIALSCQLLGEFDERRMNAFCFRQFKKPFRQLSSDDAIILIEIQKNMLVRKIKEEKKP